MTGPDPSPLDRSSPLEWDASGAPRSRRFHDIYFSAEDGLAESRAVFLAGCGLPDAWSGRSDFTIAELGFGTGLNIAALLHLWRRQGPSGARLHVFSVEAYPLEADDARRALSAWPEIGEAADALAARWPRRARGFHRVDLPEWNATLDLAVMDVAAALEEWQGRADAWFLDGFAPAANPAMWSEEVLALVAARSAPGARLATFTVAGAVRRGLQAQGFDVAKRPGHGRKRERLEARLPMAAAPRAPATPRIAVVGAGIAGASLVRAFARLGVRPLLLDASSPGAGASGNPAALVSPRLDAGGGAPARLHAQAFARAVDLYRSETPRAVIAEGALQLEAAERDGRRFDKVAASDLFEAGAIERLSPAQAGERLGEPCRAGGLQLRDALTIEPSAVIARWIGEAAQAQADVASLEPADGGWRLLDASGREIAVADIVCVAAGPGAAQLSGLPLRPVRGQVSFARSADRPSAAAWGGYVIPTRDGLLFGATHDRDDSAADLRTDDHARNLALLAKGRPALAASLAGVPLGGRASVRAAGINHMPVAGALPARPGLFVLSGLGGRGFTLAPLLAEHVAALALGASSPLPGPLAAAVAPTPSKADGPSAG